MSVPSKGAARLQLSAGVAPNRTAVLAGGVPVPDHVGQMMPTKAVPWMVTVVPPVAGPNCGDMAVMTGEPTYANAESSVGTVVPLPNVATTFASWAVPVAGILMLNCVADAVPAGQVETSAAVEPNICPGIA